MAVPAIPPVPVNARSISVGGGALARTGGGMPIYALMGDSRADYGTAVVTVGQNVKYNRLPGGIGSNVPFLTGGRVRSPFAYNVAAAGQTTVHMRDVQLPQVLAFSPQPTHCQTGPIGINDISYGVLTSAEIKSALLSAWTGLMQAGIVPVHVLDLPGKVGSVVGTITWTTAMKDRQNEINRWAAEMGRTMGFPVIDPMPVIIDVTSSTGEALASMTYDGVHGTPVEGYAVDRLIADYFLALGLGAPPKTVSRADAYDATNNPRGNLATAGGLFQSGAAAGANQGTGASGTVPTGWRNRLVSGTGTCVSSLVARTDGGLGSWWQVVITSTGADAVVFSMTLDTGLAASVTAGDRMFAECDFELGTGSVINYVQLGLEDANGSGQAEWGQDGVQVLQGSPTPVYYNPPAPLAGRKQTPTITISTGSIGPVLRVSGQIPIGGTATVRIAAVDIRKAQTGDVPR